MPCPVNAFVRQRLGRGQQRGGHKGRIILVLLQLLTKPIYVVLHGDAALEADPTPASVQHEGDAVGSDKLHCVLKGLYPRLDVVGGEVHRHVVGVGVAVDVDQDGFEHGRGRIYA